MTVIGIDLGGTKVAAASLCDRELGPTAIEPTDRSGQAGLLDQMAGLVDRVKHGELNASRQGRVSRTTAGSEAP